MIDKPCQDGRCEECGSPNCTCGHRLSDVRPLTTAERHARLLGDALPIVIYLPKPEPEPEPEEVET